ncbi:hypothetical protein ACI2L1_01870 [Streptomyces sp. NPDC019531]|uniref:hypothetical protein n=1 Tax=Streptomyces sp. NPDC019531 TaxID=3365062 RepID=UPI00384C783A
MALSMRRVEMRKQGRSTPSLLSPYRTTLSLPIVAVIVLIATGCSDEGSSPKGEKLCSGSVSAAAETALEKLTGTSSPTSRMGSSSSTPKELKKRALETEGDPWKSNTMRWFCSVGDKAEEKTLGVGASWSLVDFSYASNEINKGSKKYLRISPGAIIEKGENGRTDVYFPCQIAKDGKKTAAYTMDINISTDLSNGQDFQSNLNKVLLSVARWMSKQVECVNNPEIPAST